MIVRLEPITAIVVAVLLGWAWNTATAPGPVCQVQEFTRENHPGAAPMCRGTAASQVSLASWRSRR